MNLLGRTLHTLRVWTGLAGASESHLAPGHGWLLPMPAVARQERRESDARRAALEAQKAQA